MKKFIILIASIFLIIQSATYCQTTTFEYLLATPSNEVINDIYQAADGYIYGVGFKTKPNEYGNKAKALILKIDNEGFLIDSCIKNIPEKRYCFNNILPYGENLFVLSGYSSDTINGWPNNEGCSIELKKINDNLEILSEKSFSFPSDYSYFNMLTRRGKNNDLLISGSIIPYNIPNIFFYVINEHFDSIKASFYLDTTQTCYAVHQVNDSSYWLADGVWSNYYTLDNNLNMVSYYLARPHWVNAPYGIKWDTDTSFYLAGVWNDGPDDDVGFFRQFHPIDTTNNLFNTWGTLDTLDLPAYWDALDFNNKDSIYIGGTTNLWATNYGTWPSWYFIIQTDSNLNVRWERFYGGDAYYVMQKIIASNDGGCIIAGTRFDYQNVTEEELDIHILKLNSEGLLVGTNENPAIKMHEALVFPNPGSNYLKVRIAAQHKQSTFELYSISGKQVLSQQITGKWGEVNTTFLKTGTYIYKIYNTEGLFESGKWVKQ